MKQFPVTYRGQEFLVLVDDEDALRITERLQEIDPWTNIGGHNPWCKRTRRLSYVPAWKNRGFRPAIWDQGKLQYLARWLLKVSDPKIIVDHIDQDPLNNQRSNLRLTDRRINALNSGEKGWDRPRRSGTRGVYFDKRKGLTKPWIITKILPGQKPTQERFPTEVEAIQAREKWLETLAKVLCQNFDPKGNP